MPTTTEDRHIPTDEYTYAEVDAMRAKLAKHWGQTIDQVTEYEARHFLRNKDATPCSPKVRQMIMDLPK